MNLFSKKFPLYIQLNTADCGPSCLRMVCKYYGKNFSGKDFFDYKYTSRDGTSVNDLGLLAEKFKFEQLPVQIDFEKLQKAPLPAIAHWTQDHFVVIYKVSKNKVKIADPALGRITYDKDEFMKLWSADGEQGVVQLLKPTDAFFTLEEGEDDKYDVWFLFKYFMYYKSHLIQLILGLFVGGIIEVLFPFFTKAIVDFGIGSKNINFLYIVLAAQIGFFLSSLLIGFLRARLLLHISTRVNILFISDFLIKLLKLPVRYFDAKIVGDLTQRIQDHEKVERFLTQNFLTSVFAIFKIILLSIILLSFNTTIFFIFLIGTLCEITWIIYFLDKITVFENKRFSLFAEDQDKIFEILTSVQEIKLNNVENKKRYEWERIQVELFDLSIGRMKLDQFRVGGEQFFAYFKTISITFIAALAVINGQMTLGTMMAIVFILGQMSMPIRQLINFFVDGHIAKLSLERLTEVHTRNDEEEIDIDKNNFLPAESKSIYLNNVSFSYTLNTEDLVLSNINVSIPEGKTLAIVGVSGSGKTTLLKLLLKFYDPLEGTISIGKENLDNIMNSFWRGKCGTVMQDSIVFSDTIANNIALIEEKEEDINEDKMMQACKIANIHTFINSLPLGFNTKVGANGVGLSQGQRQRLLIARAVYSDSEYLFFDEATNALDAENEKIIINNLEKFYSDKTVVVVAHRLSTVKNADKIIVLDKGQIIECGTHDELIQQKANYYKLIKNQLELGQ